MSRVISTQNLGTVRNRLSKSIVISLRELFKKQSQDSESRDLVAYIVIALKEINETVEAAVIPWEKRGYWVKTDKFRLEWGWALKSAERLRKSLNNSDWTEIVSQLVEVGLKLNKVNVSENHRMGKPWMGAYEEYQRLELDE